MLFGHQNDDVTQPAGTPPPPPAADAASTPSTGVNPLAVDSQTGASLPVAPTLDDTAAEPESNSVLNQPTASAAYTATPSAPVAEPEAPAIYETPTPETVTPAPSVDTPAANPANDDLLALKQQALTQLSPLVSQLDQSPEEKFRTTMMLLQSTDNQALIKDAYDAAQQIPDEKIRAQALLDVVNEINYFTQQK
jgi:hypothetical protein